MSNQEILNSASRYYIDLLEYVKKLNNVNESNRKKVLNGIDITMQVMLLYLSVSNYRVSDIELDFIRLLTTEKDIIKFYNEKTNSNYTWSSLKDENMEVEEVKEFIDRTYLLFKPDIDKLIGFLASNDSITKDDELEYIKNQFRQILNLFVKLDDDYDSRFIDLILNEVFVKKYLALKEIFSKVNINL